MNTLADFTSPFFLQPQLRATTAMDAIAELGALLEQENRLPNSAEFIEAVLARENLCSTACAPGWALPHARLAGLPQLSFAFGRASIPLTWPGASPPGVSVVWLFAVPEFEAKAYLTLISAVAKLNQNSSARELLVRAEDAASLYALLQQVPLGRSAAPRLVGALG